MIPRLRMDFHLLDTRLSPARRVAYACWILSLLILTLTMDALSKPQLMEKEPIASPEGTYSANVEWDDVGFIGIVRMKVWNSDGKLVRDIELPEINPDPANLMWLDEEWVACESFIGTRGTGFFYVHVPTNKGYLLEIVAPQPNSDWVFTAASNDAISSAAVGTISRGKTSLFPILLRNAPQQEIEYFTVEFAEKLRDSIESFNTFRRTKKFRDLELLTDADIRPNIGALTVANIDRKAHVIYFPAGTTTPQEMLSRVQSIPLSEAAQKILTSPAAPKCVARWLDSGKFVVEGVSSEFASADTSATRTVLLEGKFENVRDQPYIDPKAEVSEPEDDEDKPSSAKKGITIRKSSGTSSGKKKPSSSR